VVVFSKTAADGTDPVLVVVNIDPENTFEGLLHIDLGALGLPWSGPYEAADALTGETWTWDGPDPYVKLDPHAGREAHVLALRSLAP
jgi:starch synthase (maltosyl-transferring)